MKLARLLALLALLGCGGSSGPEPARPAAPAGGSAGGAPGEADRAEAETGAATEPAPPPPRLTPVLLERPPLSETRRDGVGEGRAAGWRLRELRVQKNQITDEEAWFRENQLQLPEARPPGAVAEELRRLGPLPLARILHGDLLVYGGPAHDRTVLVGLDRGGSPEFAFDFSRYGRPYTEDFADAEFIAMELQWAEREGDTLYVSHAHRTYAASSGGDNAYVTALRVPSGDLLWRSRPLVSNARTFVLHEGALVTGYGFTREKDFLYVLDARTGRVATRRALRKGPTYLLLRDGVLYVRTYSLDYEFELTAN